MRLVSCLFFVFALLSGCATTESPREAQHALLITARDVAPSSMGEVKLTMRFEHIDGEPFGNLLWGGSGRYKVEPGHRNLGVYIYRGRTKWAGGLYGQAVIPAELRAGRTYHIVGRYEKGLGVYAVADVESRELVSEYVEVQFSVVRQGGGIPIIIPIK